MNDKNTKDRINKLIKDWMNAPESRKNTVFLSSLQLLARKILEEFGESSESSTK